MRGGFLNADHLKPRLQTSSGSCTKRAGELALGTNMAEGRERDRSVPFRHTPGREAQGCRPVRGTGWVSEATRCSAQHGAFGIRFPLSR